MTKKDGEFSLENKSVSAKLSRILSKSLVSPKIKAFIRTDPLLLSTC